MFHSEWINGTNILRLTRVFQHEMNLVEHSHATDNADHKWKPRVVKAQNMRRQNFQRFDEGQSVIPFAGV